MIPWPKTPLAGPCTRRLMAPDSESGAGRDRADIDIDDATPEMREPSSAEERWLGSYLRRAYDDVVAEPLPDSFDDLLRQLQSEDEEEPSSADPR